MNPDPKHTAFQLPPPPPGMKWHREDGWQEGDLPSGYRPLLVDEIVQKGDEYGSGDGCSSGDKFYSVVGGLAGNTAFLPKYNFFRTTRPLTFQHAGKTWTYHRPGDLMPCGGGRIVEVVLVGGNTVEHKKHGDVWLWDERGFDSVIGWRYAEPQTKIVPPGPEDVPPGSVFRLHDSDVGYEVPCEVAVDGVTFADYTGNFTMRWLELRHWQINRSIPLTGKWNPNAWEPCHKTIPQNP